MVNGILTQHSRLLVAPPARRLGSHRFAVVGMLVFAWVMTISPGMGLAETPTSLEYKVKGAFLLNFAKFTKWPADEFVATNTPITIGIVGDDPFGSALDQLVADETIGTRRIVVKRLAFSSDLSQCQVLFIPKSADAEDVLKRVVSPGVLTVGESDNFLDAGGVIRLLIEDKKVRFEVNMAAAQRARLTVSSQLLKLARTIKPLKHESNVPEPSH
jgi:hypothetical protein